MCLKEIFYKFTLKRKIVAIFYLPATLHKKKKVQENLFV